MLRPSEDRLAAGTPRATGALLVRLLLLSTAAFFSVRLLPAVLSLYVCLCVHARLSPFLSLAASTQVYVFPLLEQAVFSDTWCPVESMQPCFLCSSCILPGERGLSSIVLLFFHAFLFDAPCVVLQSIVGSGWE